MNFNEIATTSQKIDAIPLASLVESFVQKLTLYLENDSVAFIYSSREDAADMTNLLGRMEEESNKILFNTRAKDHA